MEAILGLGLINALMAASLAIVATLVGRLARRPALAHGLWLIVMVKLITPPLWSFTLPESVRWSSPKTDLTEQVTFELIDVVEDALPVVEIPPIDLPVPTLPSINWPPIIVAFWLSGSLIWLISAARRIWQFHCVIKESSPASIEIQTLTDTIAARLGLRNSPEVWTTPGSISPLIWAFAGPARLLIPESLWKTLNHEQRSTLITHELAHLRRNDHFVRWIELTATAVYWWCPVLWWARAELREAEEQCCDAWVVWAWPKAAKAYATALLETLDFLAETRPAVPLAASGAGHVRQLKRRMTMILRGLTPRSLSTTGRLALIGLAALLLPLIPTIAQDAPKREVENVKDLINDVEKLVSDRLGLILVGDVELAEKLKDGKEATKPQVRVFSGSTLRFTTTPPSKEDLEALEKARAEARELDQQLDKARKRVAELEAKISGAHGAGPLHFEIRKTPGGEILTRVPNPGGNTTQRRVIIRKNDGNEAREVFIHQNADGSANAIRLTPEVKADINFRGMAPGPDQAAKLKRIEEQLQNLQNAIKELKAGRDEQVENERLNLDRVRGRAIEAAAGQIKRAEAKAQEAREKAEKAAKEKKNDEKKRDKEEKKENDEKRDK